MALTKVSTDGVKDDAVTTDKLANAINTERTANTAKVSTTINNNADNRVITGSGTANTLEGESSLTYSASGDLTQTVTVDGKGIVLSAGNVKPMITGDSNRTGAGNTILGISGKWNGTEVARIAVEAGADTTNKDDGTLNFSTTTSGGSLTKRMVIDADGNVGIGTSSPNAFSNYTTLTINGGSDGAGIDLELSDNNIYGRFFADTTGLQIQSAQSGDSIRFETNGSNVRARITDDGLCFGSDSAAANALDDYEEGSFSPTVASGGTVSSYTHQYGYYIKIGRIVYWQIYMAINGSGSSGGFTLGSFPFTSGAYNSTGYGGATVGYANNTFQTDNMYLYQEQNSTTLIFRDRAGQAIAGNSGAIFANADFILFGQYITA